MEGYGYFDYSDTNLLDAGGVYSSATVEYHHSLNTAYLSVSGELTGTFTINNVTQVTTRNFDIISNIGFPVEDIGINNGDQIIFSVVANPGDIMNGFEIRLLEVDGAEDSSSDSTVNQSTSSDSTVNKSTSSISSDSTINMSTSSESTIIFSGSSSSSTLALTSSSSSLSSSSDSSSSSTSSQSSSSSTSSNSSSTQVLSSSSTELLDLSTSSQSSSSTGFPDTSSSSNSSSSSLTVVP